jgi:hypothetical protein
MLTPRSDPNVVVTLVPAEGGAATASVEPVPPAADQGSQKTPGKSSKKADKTADKPADGTAAPTDGAGATGTGGAAATETAPPPTVTPPPVTPPPKKTEYTTMRQIKDAVRAGQITKAEYSSWQGIIRQKRQAEFDATRKDLEAHKITKAQYEEKIRAIKLKYEG